jgi:hypothetical protein
MRDAIKGDRIVRIFAILGEFFNQRHILETTRKAQTFVLASPPKRKGNKTKLAKKWLGYSMGHFHPNIWSPWMQRTRRPKFR